MVFEGYCKHARYYLPSTNRSFLGLTNTGPSHTDLVLRIPNSAVYVISSPPKQVPNSLHIGAACPSSTEQTYSKLCSSAITTESMTFPSGLFEKGKCKQIPKYHHPCIKLKSHKPALCSLSLIPLKTLLE